MKSETETVVEAVVETKGQRIKVGAYLIPSE